MFRQGKQQVPNATWGEKSKSQITVTTATYKAKECRNWGYHTLLMMMTSANSTWSVNRSTIFRSSLSSAFFSIRSFTVSTDLSPYAWCLHMYVCMYLCMYVFMYTHTHTLVWTRKYYLYWPEAYVWCLHINIYIYVYICMYVYMYVCWHMYTYTHIH